MSNAALDWAFALPIRGAEKSVLVALANRAHAGTHECFPMQSTLALESGISERSVRAALDRLEAAGIIEADRKPGRISRYVLNLDAVVKSEPTSAFGGKQKRNLVPVESEASSGRNRKVVPCKSEATSEEPTRTQKRTQREPKGTREHDDAFDPWWDQYPRKVGKGQARRAYAAAAKKVSHEVLLAAVIAYPFDLTRPEYIPHASTWLNGERWADEVAPVETDEERLYRAAGLTPPRNGYGHELDGEALELFPRLLQ